MSGVYNSIFHKEIDFVPMLRGISLYRAPLGMRLLKAKCRLQSLKKISFCAEVGSKDV